MRLIYPENGLYQLVKNDLENVKSLLSGVANISFSVPDSFNESGGLMELSSTIQSFQRKVDSLLDRASQVTNLYRDLDEELKGNTAILDSQIVTKRERLIK